MGLEIRRVPPDWEHPRDERGLFRPLFDQSYEEAATEWLSGLMDWEADKSGERTCAMRECDIRYFWDWDGGPPDKSHYRPAWTPEQATHYQVYETVSEGTPVTPHYATKAELVDHLVRHGDAWDDGGWRREAAELFIERGWAPSFVFDFTAGGATGKAPRDGA